DIGAAQTVQCGHRVIGMGRPPAAPLTPLDQLRSDLHDILRAAVAAADPRRLMDRAWRGGRLEAALTAGPFALVAAGKAAVPMAAALSERCDDQIEQAVIACPGSVNAPLPSAWERFDAAHPFPDGESVR